MSFAVYTAEYVCFPHPLPLPMLDIKLNAFAYAASKLQSLFSLFLSRVQEIRLFK